MTPYISSGLASAISNRAVCERLPARSTAVSSNTSPGAVSAAWLRVSGSRYETAEPLCLSSKWLRSSSAQAHERAPSPSQEKPVITGATESTQTEHEMSITEPEEPLSASCQTPSGMPSRTTSKPPSDPARAAADTPPAEAVTVSPGAAEPRRMRPSPAPRYFVPPSLQPSREMVPASSTQ